MCIRDRCSALVFQAPQRKRTWRPSFRKAIGSFYSQPKPDDRRRCFQTRFVHIPDVYKRQVLGTKLVAFAVEAKVRTLKPRVVAAKIFASNIAFCMVLFWWCMCYLVVFNQFQEYVFSLVDICYIISAYVQSSSFLFKVYTKLILLKIFGKIHKQYVFFYSNI